MGLGDTTEDLAFYSLLWTEGRLGTARPLVLDKCVRLQTVTAGVRVLNGAGGAWAASTLLVGLL